MKWNFIEHTPLFSPKSGAYFWLTLGLALVSSGLWAQQANFVHSFGAGLGDQANSIVVDASDNVYMVGFFQGTVDFDPSTNVSNLTSIGGQDIFIAKYDFIGELIWARAISGAADENALGIAIDSQNEIIVTGTFQGTVDFDPSGDTLSIAATGTEDAFLAKFDSDGNIIWVFGLGGSGNDSGRGVRVDQADNIYLTGGMQNTLDFDPSGVTENRTSTGGDDVYLASYGPFGNFRWAFTLGFPSSSDFGISLDVDQTDGVFMTGVFSTDGTGIDFDPGGGTANLVSQNFTQDGFVAKYDTLGNYQWAFALGSASISLGEQVTACEVDQSGNIYVGGYFLETVDFDPSGAGFSLTSRGRTDAYLAKYTTNGDFLWVVSGGDTISGNETDDFCLGISVDTQNDVLMSGFFGGDAVFDGSSSALISQGGEDAFLVKYTSEGDYCWGLGVGGTDAEQMLDIATDSFDAVYATGFYNGAADFDPLGGEGQLIASGGTDIFLGNYAFVPLPDIFIDPASLSFTMNTSDSFSEAQSFTITAGEFQEAVEIQSPLDYYEFSEDSLTFSDTIFVEIPAEEDVKVFVRLKSQPATGFYDDVLLISSTDTLTLFGTIIDGFTATIVESVLEGFQATTTAPSTAQTFTFSTSTDTTGIEMASELGFYEFSTDGNTYADTLLLELNSEDVFTYFVRLKAQEVTGFYDDALIFGGDTLLFFGEVLGTEVVANPDSLTDFLAGLDFSSAIQSFTLSSAEEVNTLDVTSLNNFYEFTRDTLSTFSDTLVLTLAAESTLEIFVRLKAQEEIGMYDDLVIVPGDTLLMLGQVVQPEITLFGTNFLSFDATESEASISQSYEVSGFDLIDQVTITSGGLMELSLDDITFVDQLILNVVDGVVEGEAAEVFVRLRSGLTAGDYTDTLFHSSNRATTQELIVSGTVSGNIAAPSGLSLRVENLNTITLDWIDNTNVETGYVVERKDSANGDFNRFANLPQNSITYTDNTVVPGTTYFYRVGVQDTSGFVIYSETLGAVTGIPTSTEDDLIRATTSVFPTVATASIWLEMDNAYLGEVVLKVIHLSGKQVREVFLQKSQKRLKYSLDLNNIPLGMYFITVQTRRGGTILRFFKN